MTPEREEEIRAWVAQKQHCEFYGSHWLMASDLLAEIDSLRAQLEEPIVYCPAEDALRKALREDA